MEYPAGPADNVGDFTTEAVDPRYADLDLMPTEAIAEAMNEADKQVPLAIGEAIPQITAAINAISSGMQRGGRLFYVGAGTSGRLGVLDASECPPTFSSSPDQVVGLIAGGDHALRNAIEGAEDDFDDGYATLDAQGLRPNDSVVGIAASGRTPYVLGAIQAASDARATTVGLCNNPGAVLSQAVDFPIEVVVGPEIVSGSTRLKAGSAQKQVLNMISTIAMVRLGKTYGNLMVDVSASNEKLYARARNLVMRVTGCDEPTAIEALERCDGSVKTAAVSILLGIDADAARARLASKGGALRAALGD